jgi:membrane glycosyltransferase
VLFAVTLPWSVIGFWNATIGLFIMRSADPVAAVTPVSARVTGDEPITAKTAILWCVRNEDTERVIRNIEPMMEGSSRPARRAIPCLHPERHQLSGDRRRRGAALSPR